jgi:hypothetical protein
MFGALDDVAVHESFSEMRFAVRAQSVNDDTSTLTRLHDRIGRVSDVKPKDIVGPDR